MSPTLHHHPEGDNQKIVSNTRPQNTLFRVHSFLRDKTNCDLLHRPTFIPVTDTLFSFADYDYKTLARSGEEDEIHHYRTRNQVTPDLVRSVSDPERSSTIFPNA